TPLKLQLQPELHDARIDAHCADPSERARAGDVIRRIGEVWPIEDVEDFPAEHQAGLLAESCALDKRHVDIALTGTSENIPAYVAKDRPAAGHGIFPIDQTAVRDERRGNKHAGIEELIETAAHAAIQNRVV